MTAANDADTRTTLAKLAQSRAEILAILEPAPADPAVDEPAGAAGGGFPRSRTMKLLLSGRGLGTVGALLAGLAIARPALALRLLRLLPAGAVTRMLLVKSIATLVAGARRRPAGRRRGSAERGGAGPGAADTPAGEPLNPS